MRRKVIVDEPVHELRHTVAVVPREHEVGRLLQQGNRVGDRRAVLGEAQHAVVVLRVAHGHHVVGREPQAIERRRQARRLRDARRQDHHRALVEDHVQLEAEVTDGLENRHLVRRPGRDDRLAHGHRRHAPGPQRLDEPRGRRLGEQLRRPGLRVEQHAAVLGHHQVEQIDAREDGQELVEHASGHQDELPAGGAQAFQRGDSPVVHPSVVRRVPS